ncbi:hypothetical protein NDU88_000652 [Pleurodeles waltl]|uniref:Uncharacterized protein n=1 Tax=Pleurodeles waltl TaxID=8319 RepID=A0AAV7P6C6_PLEWA|nr:hypothetical protein NDU88_000652 [Pleurodeles waltl]
MSRQADSQWTPPTLVMHPIRVMNPIRITSQFAVRTALTRVRRLRGALALAAALSITVVGLSVYIMGEYRSLQSVVRPGSEGKPVLRTAPDKKAPKAALQRPETTVRCCHLVALAGSGTGTSVSISLKMKETGRRPKAPALL